MKKLLQVGLTGASLAMLHVPTVHAVNTVTPFTQAKSIQTLNRPLGLKNAIAFLENKLIAATKQASQTTPQKIETTSSSFEIANFFPANTPALAFVNTKAETWGSLNRFHLFHMVQQSISQLIPKNANFNYVRDVQSFLGEEIGIGFLPKVPNQTATINSSSVIIAPIRDAGRLQSLINVVQQDKARVKVRQYNDATVYEINISSDTALTNNTSRAKSKLRNMAPAKKISPEVLVIASFKGYVALGFSAKPIEQIIDTKNANVATVGQKPEFKEFTQRQRTNGALYSMYQNPYEYMVLFNDLIKDISNQSEFKDFKNLSNLTLPRPEQFKQYNSIYSSITQQSEGLRFQVQTFLNPNSDKLKSTKPEQPIISQMPGATYSALTGSNINLQWQALTTLLSATVPEFNNGLKGFREFVKSATGLDFDKEIIGWMDGEYGLFMYPTKGGFFNVISPNFNLGLGLVVKTTNRSLAENTLSKLGEFVETSTNGEVVLKNSDIKGQAVTSWDAPNDSSKSLLAYSWLNTDTLLITSGFGAITDLVPQPKAPLASTYNFSNATATLPLPNQGYFYVNTGSFLSWVYGFVPQEYQSNQYFKVFKQVAGSVHSLSATTSKIKQGENVGEQFDFLVALAPTRLNSARGQLTSN